MKRLIGGLFLLNLTAISLGLTAGEVSISDEEVLSQLLELRNFIDDKRDFTKGFKDLKPVLVQYRSSASKIDGVVPCNLSFNTDALHLSIAGYSVQADGTPITLRINVVYEWTDYVGYTIKTAKLEATKTISGDIAFEDIVDKEGHKRFQEWDIETETITGVTFTYAKASLSGSHIMFVLAGDIDDATTISGKLGSIVLPEWIFDKIYPTFSVIVELKPVTIYASDYTTQNLSVQLQKRDSDMQIHTSSLTTTKARMFRIAFDLLIDNEE